jgi:hypothetical protein
MKQCGACKFAAGFDYGPGPSGNQDGVNCTSQEHATWLDEQAGGNRFRQELAEHGHMDLFRLEILEPEDYECPHWQPKE